MKLLAPREQALAVALASLAGFVDSIGFIQLGGLFVSFMSGNSTRLGVGLAAGDWTLAAQAAGLLAGFVAGAALGRVARGRAPGRHARTRVLALETGLLTAAAASALFGHVGPAALLLVLAMGVENAVFLRGGEVGVGLTYMTGVLVRLGHALGARLLGQPSPGVGANLLLWAGLMAGALGGALAYGGLGAAALAIAAIAAAIMTAWAALSRAVGTSG